MVRDSRGGHNRIKINENFFKIWSPSMAYILGLIFADGTIEDVRKSSRTCYIQISNNDKDLLEKVRDALDSSHPIHLRKSSLRYFYGKFYRCATSFNLRIGNKLMYNDLTILGVTPRKSLTMEFPNIPQKHFRYFLRGYFDGDGCISVYNKKPGRSLIIQVIFTSGSLKFLRSLHAKIGSLFNATGGIFKGTRCFRLSYKKNDSLKILRFMYFGLEKAPFLKRKYQKYLSAYKT